MYLNLSTVGVLPLPLLHVLRMGLIGPYDPPGFFCQRLQRQGLGSTEGEPAISPETDALEAYASSRSKGVRSNV